MRFLKRCAVLFFVVVLIQTAVLCVYFVECVVAPTPLPDQEHSGRYRGVIDVTQPLRAPAMRPTTEFDPIGSIANAFVSEAMANGFSIDVMDRGAVGDGMTDDGPAFQAAATELSNTGGVIWVPPNRTYKINSTIDIRSYYPIFVVSTMGRGAHGVAVADRGYILPGATVTNGIFRWRAPNGETNAFEHGSGGCIRVTFCDPTIRTIELDSAIYVEDGNFFEVRECYFWYLNGSALRIGNSVRCAQYGGEVFRCGDDLGTDEPAIRVAGGPNDAAHNSGFGAYWADGVTFHSNKECATVAVALRCDARMRNCYFENIGTGSQDDEEFPFVSAAGVVQLYQNSFNALAAGVNQVEITDIGSPQGFNRVIDNQFRGAGRALNVVTSQLGQANGNHILGAGGDSEAALTIGNGYWQLNDNVFYASGKLQFAGAGGVVTGTQVYSTSETTAGTEIDVPTGTVCSGNSGEGTATALTIASDAATKLAWKKAHTLTGQGGVADDLVTLNGGAEGDRVTLRATSDSVTITLKHGTGNLQIGGNADFVLDSSNDSAECYYNGTKWIVTAINAGT
jgi:hypothetical protein